jgi:N-dimethylarginine dimethylaminohydrolase
LKLVLNHMFQKFEIFWTNIASTMTYPNFKNGPKNGLRPLGVKVIQIHLEMISLKDTSVRC